MLEDVEKLIEYCFKMGQSGYNSAEDFDLYKKKAMEEAERLNMFVVPINQYGPPNQHDYCDDVPLTTMCRGIELDDHGELKELPLEVWDRILEAFENKGKLAGLSIAHKAKEWSIQEARVVIERVWDKVVWKENRPVS